MSQLLIYGPHAAVGLLALAMYWQALTAPKGSDRHRRWGRRYLILLAPLLVSVVPITLQAVRDEGPAKAMQLVYLAVVLATAGWTAWRAVRERGDAGRFRGRTYLTLATLMVGLGAVLLVVGILKWDVLAVGFSVIGLVYGGAMLGFSPGRAAADWWLTWHLNGICLLFAATHASFVGLVFRTLLPAQDGRAMHALTQLGTIALAYLLRQWMGRRFQGEARVPAPAPAG
ncbi:MAG: hypothetical protein R3F55_11740 [Alphaproteobacteria bacterium]